MKLKQNSKMLRRLACFLSVFLIMTALLGVTVSAAEVGSKPYDSYTIWNGYGTMLTTSQRPVYEYQTTINSDVLGISALKEPNDVSTDTKGNVYITDTANGRVIVLNPDLTKKSVLQNLKYGEETLDFTGALGAYAHTDGKLYIADTQNGRVIVCDATGKVYDLLTLPDADVIPSDFQFMPKRIAIDSKGYKYVVSEGSYYGAILYGPDGEFVSFYGSNTVTSTLGDIFDKVWEVFFASETLQAEKVKTLPFQFTDIAVDGDDFIYTATGATNIYKADPGQLKKLSPGGVNVLKDKNKTEVTSSDSLQFSDAFKSVRASSSENRVTSLASMTLDENGFMYTADTTYGRVYIYDQNCNPIAVFGGGTGIASQKGMSGAVSSLAIGKDGAVILCDRINGALQIYKRTDYGRLLLDAQAKTVVGAYAEAQPKWEEILRLDRNCQLAYRGLAKAYLVAEEYDKALEYAKIGIDQDTYASAFEYVRGDYLAKNFTWLFLIAVVVVGAFAAMLYVTSKREVKLIKNRQVSLMFRCILHPFQSFNRIRYEGEGSVLLATVVLIIFYIATFISRVYGGFMYQIFDKTTFNSFIVLLGTVGLVLLWVICNWGMATLFEGKGKVKHIYICTCYSLIPITAYYFIYTVLSNFVVPEESLVITVIYYVCFALTAIMFCISVMTVHEFGFGKFVGITIISVIAMLVVVFMLFMVSILVQQFGSFFVTVYKEVKYR